MLNMTDVVLVGRRWPATVLEIVFFFVIINNYIVDDKAPEKRVAP